MFTKSTRFISIILTITMLFVCIPSSVFAAETKVQDEASVQIQDKVDENASDQMDQIENDLIKLETLGIPKEYLQHVSFDEKLTYEYQLPDLQEKTYINVAALPNGTRLTIKEGLKEDVLDYTTDGNLYLDGEEIETTVKGNESAANNNPTVLRTGTRTEYSTTPFTSKGLYYVDTNGSVTSVDAKKSIISITASALSVILRAVLLKSISAISVALTAAKILSHATSVQALAKRTGYKGNYLSFNWTKSDHQNNDAFIKNYKYSFTYFANKYCNAPGTVGLLYQKTIIY